MKKVIAIISACLLVGILVFFGISLFKSSNVKSIEIVGEIQTIYFVNSTNDVNFNDADLKITYDDGSVSIKKLNKDLVQITNFNTSVENKGLMKIKYKSTVLDVGYAVICKGLYYMSEKIEESYDGSNVNTKNSGLLIAGVNENNEDNTTSTEMIYFGDKGVCDYYHRQDSTSDWYLDNGYNNGKYYYEINGNELNVHLGENVVYSLVATFSNDGEISLSSVNRTYVSDLSEFLKTKTSRQFKHYEMKGNRTINTGDISVVCDKPIIFAKDSKFTDSDLDIYLKVTYTGDSFLKTVYVNFNESMFGENQFTTSYVTPKTKAMCYFNGVRFELEYAVYVV